MRTFDQIIFDELTAQRAVLLEDIGYLKIENIPARIADKNSVIAPRKVVVYTPETPAGARNVINILESEGVDYQQARDQYYAWLADARKDGALRIYSAGVLKDGIFMPTAELDKKLNPDFRAAVIVKRNSMAWLWIVVIIVLALLVFLGFHFCGSTDNTDGRQQTVTVQTQKPAVEAVPDTVSTAVIPVDNGQGTGLNYPVPGRYYVVAGVFDIPENADRLINSLKRQFPDLTFEKFDYPGTRPDRTMVTVYSSTKHHETLNMRRELAWSYDLHDFWIYPPSN